MRTKLANVFLDTTVFEAELFRFDSDHFETLEMWIRSDLAQVILTDVTYAEVEAHIDAAIAKAIGALKFKDESKERAVDVLRQFDDEFACIFKKHDRVAMAATVKERLAFFCDHNRVNVLSTDKVKFAPIRANYFGNKPPFSEGRKKSEFPDAFAAAALDEWTREHGNELFVVSADKDWKDICDARPGFIWHENIASFLAVFQDNEQVEQIRNALWKDASLKEGVEEEFQELNFYLSGVEGEVRGFKRIDATITSVLITNRRDGEATAEVDCEVQYEAEIEYLHLPDRRFHYQEEYGLDPYWQKGTANDTVEMTATVEIKYRDEDPSDINIVSIALEPRGLNIEMYSVKEHG